jgi:hypothetical protein
MGVIFGFAGTARLRMTLARVRQRCRRSKNSALWLPEEADKFILRWAIKAVGISRSACEASLRTLLKPQFVNRSWLVNCGGSFCPYVDAVDRRDRPLAIRRCTFDLFWSPSWKCRLRIRDRFSGDSGHEQS